MGKRIPESLEVYGPNTRYSAAPDRVISFDEGSRLVEAGHASFCKHNRAIRMKVVRPLIKAGASAECNKLWVEQYAELERKGLDAKSCA